MEGEQLRTIWESEADPAAVRIIDQTLLPHRLEIMDLRKSADFIAAIADMKVRGAGLIGATAAYGMRAAALEAPDADFDASIRVAAAALVRTRPTAKNLEWAVMRVLDAMGKEASPSRKRTAALETARGIARFDAECSRAIGLFGLGLIERIAAKRGGESVRILTHCNAGALAFVERGTATAPIYEAHDRGIPLHVWVDETRPRNQGASLTAWELGRYGVPHSLIADNAGGHLMQRGLVDMVIVGADRVARNGDVANKIGTYLKALAARDSGLPFYVALPSSTLDWEIADGIRDIPIEERTSEEVEYVEGLIVEESRIARVRICPAATRARNFGFDVTPARLVTAFITERGICPASEEGILGLFPEMGAGESRRGGTS